MSAEERWADRMEWAEEKRRGFDVEIKIDHDVTGTGLSCDVPKCASPAVHSHAIGPVSGKWSTPVCLCEDHNSEENAFEIYRDTADEAPDLD